MRDEANTYVLESIIVASLMVSSIAFVATFDAPRSSSATRADLAQRIADAAAILHDTPFRNSSMGDTLLSVAVAECLQGNCSRLDTKVTRLLPQGTRYAAYLSNGYALYPLVDEGSPAGEAVSARVAFEPRWSHTLLSPAAPDVNPIGDPVVLYALPIYNSNVLTSDGTPFVVNIKGVRASDGAQFGVQGAGTTRASGAGEVAPHAAVSAYFVDAAGQPVASLDGRATTLTPQKTPTRAPLPLAVRVVESGGGSVPAGTRLTVTMPPGWTASAPSAANAALWDVVANATDANGSSVVAKLKAALSGASADLKLAATYEGDKHDGYALRAELSGGAGAVATLLVRGDAKDASATFEAPSVLVSAPRPLGVGSTTTWTVTSQLPGAVPGFPAEAVLVEEVTVRADSGEPIFASVAGLSPGAWTLEGANLTWRGSVLVTHDAPLSLAFNASGRAVARPPSDRASYTPAVSLEGQRALVADETSPGLRRTALAPDGRAGYNGSAGLLLSETHVVVSDAPYRATELPGSASYTVGYARPTGDALFGCQVQPSARFVGAGEDAFLHVNVQPATYTLAEAGLSPAARLNIYPPWSGDARVPIKTVTLSLPTTLASIDANGDGEPDADDAGVYDIMLRIPREWPFGPYLVEGEVSWTEVVTQTIDGVELNETLDRSARVYDYFVVTPPGALTPPVPVYELHLVAWFEDWR